eukprot:gnl/Dysnectes_brevis/3765_a4838_950.p1 GENE.gnl/Dysnectes_brevis/3765_a4838_950~~gnl/Dysnectes_brevis/3765_a4838_950.p1  ORF type:complete len:278 (-),score=17.99 gnl/Dysnectes_brevis/3765_a4838_950:73-906(-)
MSINFTDLIISLVCTLVVLSCAIINWLDSKTKRANQPRETFTCVPIFTKIDLYYITLVFTYLSFSVYNFSTDNGSFSPTFANKLSVISSSCFYGGQIVCYAMAGITFAHLLGHLLTQQHAHRLYTTVLVVELLTAVINAVFIVYYASVYFHDSEEFVHVVNNITIIIGSVQIGCIAVISIWGRRAIGEVAILPSRSSRFKFNSLMAFLLVIYQATILLLLVLTTYFSFLEPAEIIIDDITSVLASLVFGLLLIDNKCQGMKQQNVTAPLLDCDDSFL